MPSTTKVEVFSAAFTTNRSRFRLLEESAERQGLRVNFFGADRAFSEWEPSNSTFLTKVILGKLIEVLRESEAEYVVLTDSFDTLCCRWNPEEVIAEIDAAGGLLISAEANCFPEGPWHEKYDSVFPESPWRYGNLGQTCGLRRRLIKFFEDGLERLNLDSTHIQEAFHRMWMEGYPAELDYECRIFQSMFLDVSKNITWDGKKVRNPITGSEPMFLHFNGRAPGIEEWAFRLKGN